MEQFDWTHLNLIFPEFISTGSDFWKNFQETPKFQMGIVDFKLKDIGVEIYLPKIPDWLGANVIVNKKIVKGFYERLSKIVYEQVRGELTRCLPVFARWKPNVYRYQRAIKEWAGEIPNQLEFTNGLKSVSVGDYSHMRKGVRRFSLTDVVLRLGKIPEKMLVNELRRYRTFSDFVIENNRGCNSVTGKGLVDCVKNLDLVYSALGGLRDLKFE